MSSLTKEWKTFVEKNPQLKLKDKPHCVGIRWEQFDDEEVFLAISFPTFTGVPPCPRATRDIINDYVRQGVPVGIEILDDRENTTYWMIRKELDEKWIDFLERIGNRGGLPRAWFIDNEESWGTVSMP